MLFFDSIPFAFLVNSAIPMVFVRHFFVYPRALLLIFMPTTGVLLQLFKFPEIVDGVILFGLFTRNGFSINMCAIVCMHRKVDGIRLKRFKP